MAKPISRMAKPIQTNSRAAHLCLLAAALSGCSAKGGSAGIDGGDTASDRSSDAADGRDVPSDVRDAADGQDVPPDVRDAADAQVEAGEIDATLCPMESDNGALVPAAPACAAAPMAISAATLCPAGGACPVSALFSLTCAMGGMGPWVVPTGTGGTVMYVTNTGGFITRLFTLLPGAPAQVDTVPEPTSAMNTLAVDREGNPTIFAGEMPGIWRLRKTPTGWRREHAVDFGTSLAMVTDGRAIDATKAYVAYYDLSDGLPRLAVRDGGCWRSTVLPGGPALFIGMDVDSMSRPWAAWLGHAAGLPALSVAGPDGGHVAWTTTVPDALIPNERPVVLAGGWTGTSSYPALAFRRPEGVHVLGPGDLPRWTDRLLPGTAQAVHTNDCPPPTTPPVAGGLACGGRTSCQATTKGALAGFGMARTSAGRTYTAWLTSDGGTTYALSTPASPVGGCPPTAPAGGGAAMPIIPPMCLCIQTPTETHGTATIVITRVDTPAATDVLRLTLDAGRELRGGTALAVAARGNTLLIVASIGTGTDTVMRYLEIDTAQLP